jgi:hypothetical protein
MPATFNWKRERGPFEQSPIQCLEHERRELLDHVTVLTKLT